LFVQRAQRHTPDLGQPRAEYLLTDAYRLIAELKGRTSQAKLPLLGAAVELPPIPLLFGKAANRIVLEWTEELSFAEDPPMGRPFEPSRWMRVSRDGHQNDHADTNVAPALACGGAESAQHVASCALPAVK
jgi:hypothetical protein